MPGSLTEKHHIHKQHSMSPFVLLQKHGKTLSLRVFDLLLIFTGTIGTNLASFECFYSYSVIARWYHPFQIPRVFICYLYGRFRLFRSLFAVYYASGQRHVVFSSSNRSSPKLTMAAPVLPLDPNPDALAALAAPLAPPVACGATRYSTRSRKCTSRGSP